MTEKYPIHKCIVSGVELLRDSTTGYSKRHWIFNAAADSLYENRLPSETESQYTARTVVDPRITIQREGDGYTVRLDDGVTAVFRRVYGRPTDPRVTWDPIGQYYVEATILEG